MFAVLRGTPWQLIPCGWQLLCVWMLTLHIYLLWHRRILHASLSLLCFVLFSIPLWFLIASFASVFNGSICLGKQDDGCMVLWVLAHLQGLVPTPGADRVVWQSSKLEAETFKLGWMAGWEHSEDKEILNCTPGQSEERKVYCWKHASREGNVSKHF